MSPEMLSKLRGYLSLSAKSLLDNKTIKHVRLAELKELVEKSQVILTESQDCKKIEFKLVYRKYGSQFCKADRIVQEHILLKFNIDIK